MPVSWSAARVIASCGSWRGAGLLGVDCDVTGDFVGGLSGDFGAVAAFGPEVTAVRKDLAAAIADPGGVEVRA